MNKENNYVKKGFLILFTLILIIGFIPTKVFAAEAPQFSGGVGSQNDPWLISSTQDLVSLSQFVNSGDASTYDTENNGIGNLNGYYFKQTADIDLSKIAWEPIGYSGEFYFAGNYNGDNYMISNIKCIGKNDSDGYATAGLFGWATFGMISNTHVKDSSFEATGNRNYSYVGGIAGVAYGSTITNCSVMNSTLSSKRDGFNNNCSGSIAGYSTGGIFQKCASENNEVKATAYCGGFVGEVDDDYGVGSSSFNDCYVANTSVIVSSQNSSDVNIAGGFVGEMTASPLTLKNCFVYNMQIKVAEDSQSNSQLLGIFAGNLWGNSSKINANNCYYGECNVNNNVGDAQNKSMTEFKNGTVANALGKNFINKSNFPTITSLPADYTAVNKAIAGIPSQLDLYTENSVKRLNNALDAVIYHKEAFDQSYVDGYASTIKTAISNLTYKDADYSLVDSAMSKIPKDLTKYTDSSVQNLNNVIKAVIYNKNITEQEVVNEYARLIVKAIDNLRLNPTIISGFNQTIAYGKDATFKSNDDFTAFKKVLIDNIEISSMNYKLEEGSIIVILKADYLKTLSEGKHKISIISSHGIAETVFYITKPDDTNTSSKESSSTIKTNDYTNINLFILASIVSGGLYLYLKSKHNPNKNI